MHKVQALTLPVLLAMNFAAMGQTQPSQEPAVRIAQFRDDCAAAVIYAFDDGLRDQAQLAAPMLERFGFHGTFFIIPGVVPDTEAEAALKKPGAWGGISWTRLKEMSDAGHEIASHSWSHQMMRLLDDATLAQEVDKADERITEKIGHSPLTFAYPGNSYDKRVHASVMSHHIAARESNMFGFGGPQFTAQTANNWVDGLIQKHQWGITVIHGIVEGYAPMTSAQVFQDHLNYVKQHESQVWVDTFANVARYMQERDSAKLTVTQSPGEAKCVVQTPLDPSIFNIPLTLVIDAPGATQAEAGRPEQKIPVRIANGRLYVDCPPGPEGITVSWK